MKKKPAKVTKDPKKEKKISFKELVALLKRYYRFTKEHFWQWGVWRIVGGFGSATIGILIPRLIGTSLDIAGEAFETKVFTGVWSFVGAIAGLTVFRCIIGYTNSLSSYRYSILSGRKLRVSAMDRINSLPISFFESKHTGEVISRVVNDIDKLQKFYGDSVGGVWSYLPANLIVGLWVLLDISPWLTLVCLCVIPPVTFISSKLGLSIADNTKRIQEHAVRYNSYLRDFFEGIEIYKIFGLEKRHGKNFTDAVDDEKNEAFKKVKRMVISWAVGSVNYMLPWVLSYTVGAFFVARGIDGLTVGGLFAFATVLPYVSNISYMASLSWTTMVEHAGIAKNFFELLDESPERTDGGDFSCPGEGVRLAFEGISYTYPNGLSVVEDCSFDVPAGRTVALVGASGSGKSTLFKLLCGYYTSYGGRIVINGAELSEWNLDALRKNIAYVSQESYLFDATIMENIRYGKLDATDDEVREAAKKAYADEFISAFEDGYQTRLGERGVRLSGGQRQRISIARAILKGAPLILMDEPTAALDTKAEFFVQKALDNLAVNKTVFVIAHRISTIENADNIVVLENGRIIEQGSHEKLISGGGRYIELYSSQISTGGGSDDETEE